MKRREDRNTNKFFTDFGPATKDELVAWGKKTAEEKKKRMTWLKQKEGVSLPLGPYPFHDKKHGWMTLDMDDKDWIANYTARTDGKLGLAFSCPNGLQTECSSVEVRLMQETFDPQNNCYTTGDQWTKKIHGELFVHLLVCLFVLAC